MKNFLDSLPKNATFEQRWKDISTNYPLLVQFEGGLHSVFPGTSTVEGDFRDIKQGMNEYIQRLTIFTLEGILHAKQREDMKKIEEILLKSMS